MSKCLFRVSNFYKGNLNIPVLNWTSCKTDSDKQTSFEEVLKLLYLNPLPLHKVAVEKPVCVKKNCRIVVDTTSMGHPDDILADDCGVWISKGSPKVYFQQENDDPVSFERVGRGKNVPQESLQEPWCVVQRSYFSNKDAPDFKRVVSTVKGKKYHSTVMGNGFKILSSTGALENPIFQFTKEALGTRMSCQSP